MNEMHAKWTRILILTKAVVQLSLQGFMLIKSSILSNNYCTGCGLPVKENFPPNDKANLPA